MSRKLYFTPVKRSQLITTSGVGSLVRTRNGVTALVRGLTDWQSTIPISKHFVGPDRDIARERFLRSLTLRDPELESACDVARFVQPQSLPDNPKTYEDWLVPVVRFPLAGFCSNWKCGRLILSIADSPSTARCTYCHPDKPRLVQQIPIFKVCKAGHIEEVDWNLASHDGCPHECKSKSLKIKIGVTLKRMLAECNDCGCKSNADNLEDQCSGNKAWLPGSTPDVCAEQMHIVERTSVQVYYSNVKSALHLPSDDELNSTLLDWILSNGNIDHIDLASDIQINGFIQQLSQVNIQVSVEEFKKHVLHLKNLYAQNERAEWNREQSRTRELDVLTDIHEITPKYGPKLLEKEIVDLAGLSSDLFGDQGLFSKVVSVHKLTETRIQDGFSRFVPEMPSSKAGQKQLWGLGDAKSPWLPGYRVYGEGILFVINSEAIKKWQGKFANASKSRINRETVAHTLAHLILSQAALECGYQVAGIRDRIYDLQDGRLAFLVYAAEGDSVGTLGGLVELSLPHRLEDLVRDALAEGQWCAQDPVCISETTYQLQHNPGSCHQCVLLPETSCEMFNSNLDRAAIFGNSERDVPGFVELVVEK